MAKLNRDKTSYERELEEKLQSLRQRNAELEAEIKNIQNDVDEYRHISNQQATEILSQQLTIENMREALELCKTEYEGLPHSLGYEFTHLPSINKALSLQPSTAELAKHDKAIRVEEREACAKVAEQGNFLHDSAPDALFGKSCGKAIRQRKTS